MISVHSRRRSEHGTPSGRMVRGRKRRDWRRGDCDHAGRLKRGTGVASGRFRCGIEGDGSRQCATRRRQTRPPQNRGGIRGRFSVCRIYGWRNRTPERCRHRVRRATIHYSPYHITPVGGPAGRLAPTAAALVQMPPVETLVLDLPAPMPGELGGLRLFPRSPWWRSCQVMTGSRGLCGGLPSRAGARLRDSSHLEGDSEA